MIIAEYIHLQVDISEQPKLHTFLACLVATKLEFLAVLCMYLDCFKRVNNQPFV